MVTHKPKNTQSYYNRGMAYYKKREYDKAIKNYNEVIKREPDCAEAYGARGEAWLHLKEWEKAKVDLSSARDSGMDIIASFHNDYESISDFEQRNGVQLPESLAVILKQQ